MTFSAKLIKEFKETFIKKNVIFYFLTLLSISLLCVFPIQSFDLFSYLLYGNIMDRTNELIQTDPSLIIPFLTKFDLQHQWLTYSFFYNVFKYGGYVAIISLKLFLMLGCVFLYFAAIRKKHGLYPFLGVISVITFILGYFRLIERGSFFTDILTLILCFILIVMFKDKKISWFQLTNIVLIMILWTNFHPGFLFGILLIFIALLFVVFSYIKNKSKKNKQWLKDVLFLFFASLIATCIHPLGYKVSMYSIDFFTEKLAFYRLANIEWISLIQFFETQPFIVTGIVGLYLAFLVLFFMIRKENNSLYSNFIITIYILFFALGVMSLRFMFTWVLIVPLLVALMIRESKTHLELFSGKNIMNMCKFTVVILFMMIGIGKLSYTSIDNRAFGIGIDDRVLPMKAILQSDFRSNSKNIFNHIGWGGVLSFYSYPDQKVFINGFVSDPDILSLYFETMYSPTDQIIGILVEKLKIDTFIIKNTPTNLTNWLANSSDWQLTYQDNVTLIYSYKNS
tara:strand:+ start:468 stop:1997 length:1530 start_codon:yes stop_codon:yes gene_type:complete